MFKRSLGTHVFWGDQNMSYIYKELLKKIGERIKLYNAYNVVVERLSKELTFWVSSLTALDEELIKEK
jgi:hypothetical protein